MAAVHHAVTPELIEPSPLYVSVTGLVKSVFDLVVATSNCKFSNQDQSVPKNVQMTFPSPVKS